MELLITKRVPCSVCGVVTFRHDGWLLLVENRWLDHLKILTWHSALATRKEIKSACCREHLKTLVAHWLDHSNSRPLFRADTLAMPITSDPAQTELDLDPRYAGRLVGELSVHRESFSRVWTGSPEALECILEALIPAPSQKMERALEFALFEPSPRPPNGLPLH